jgi:hypothetical protein
VTYYSRAFAIFSTALTTRAWATSLSGARVRDQALGLALGSQQKSGISIGHKSTASTRPMLQAIPSTGARLHSSLYAATPGLLAALLEAINRGSPQLQGTDEHFTVFTSTTTLALASINLRDLGSFPLPISLYSLLQALRCK